eukprot:scaffold24650_cov147-Cylindrotheca_fusiformis.AAC.3
MNPTIEEHQPKVEGTPMAKMRIEETMSFHSLGSEPDPKSPRNSDGGIVTDENRSKEGNKIGNDKNKSLHTADERSEKQPRNDEKAGDPADGGPGKDDRSYHSSESKSHRSGDRSYFSGDDSRSYRSGDSRSYCSDDRSYRSGDSRRSYYSDGRSYRSGDSRSYYSGDSRSYYSDGRSYRSGDSRSYYSDDDRSYRSGDSRSYYSKKDDGSLHSEKSHHGSEGALQQPDDPKNTAYVENIVQQESMQAVPTSSVAAEPDTTTGKKRKSGFTSIFKKLKRKGKKDVGK